MRLSLPPAVENLRPERPQLVALVALLGVSFALTLGLAWQAWDAGRGEREAAEAILAANARSAAEEWAFWTHYAMQESFLVVLDPVVNVFNNVPTEQIEAEVASVLEVDGMPPGSRTDRPAELLTFTIDATEGGDTTATALLAWMRTAVQEDRELRVGRNSIAAVRADVPFGTGYLLYVARLEGQSVPTHAAVYWLDPAHFPGALLDIYTSAAVAGQGVLAVSGKPDQAFAMSAVRTLDGESVLDGGDYIREDLAVAAESNGFVRGLTLRVGLKPAAVDLFLPGGFPGSRLPALMALLGAIAMMVAVSFVLLRREAELHRMRARFVSGVSHELRTPLSQIRMFAETLMLGRARSDAERRRSLEIIDQEARRLGIMVENILTFSRGERGGVKITPEVTRISTEIQGVVRDFQALPRARRAEVRLELQDDVMVPVDRDALRQIVNNLVDNAVKYGPDGQRITVGLAIFDRAARLWVDDEGPGIPPADREHVFQSFFRLRRDEESRTAGSGIGLSVVRELAALHGGRAWVEDAPGGGTRLMVAFPEADLAAAERAAAAVA